MEKIKGIVSAVKQREKGYSIKIGFGWYGGFGDLPCKKGDEVEIEYSVDGKWNNISNLIVLTSGNDVSSSNPDVRINVDAGNILQRELDLLSLLPEVERNKTNISLMIGDGRLGELLTKEFVRIKDKLKELENPKQETEQE